MDKEALFSPLEADGRSRFELRTKPRRRKPRRIAPMLSHSATHLTLPLKQTLRPLLSTGDLHEEVPVEKVLEEEPLSENCDEQDAVIARLGLKTGDDAVNYFTGAPKSGEVKFVHLLPPHETFQPYTLKVVPAAVAVAKGDYFTMSKTGLVHCVLKKGSNATECISMSEWVRESTLFHLLRSLRYFKHFIACKTFRQWRSNVRHRLYEQQRCRLQRKLLFARESFCDAVVEVKKEIWGLKRASLISTPKARIQSDPIDAFLDAQTSTRKEAVHVFEASMKRAVDACSRACEAVLQLDENRLNHQDPRRRLDELMAARLASKQAKTISMNAVVEEKKAKKRLEKRAAEDRALLSDFVRFSDFLMVEVVAEHVVDAFSDVLLADFLDPQHKIGLFEVSVGFDPQGSLTFVPSLDDFSVMTTRLIDDVLSLVSRIPRVLDARGCGEHCTSAGYAAKFDDLIRSLPKFTTFLEKLRQKFHDDFENSRHHNAANYEIVRPIYEAMLDFQAPPPPSSETTGEPKKTYAEARTEFEELLLWQKDLEKLRTRDSVGTIEVTSRQLKQTLASFIDQKLDALKVIIRHKAAAQCQDVVNELTSRVKTLSLTPAGLDDFATFVHETAAFDEREMRRSKNAVDQMYALLLSNDVKLPPDDLVALDELHSLSATYVESLAKAKHLKESELASRSDALDEAIVALNTNLSELTESCDKGVFIDGKHFDDPGQPAVFAELQVKRETLKTLADLAGKYKNYKELFGYAGWDEFAALKKATEKLDLVEKLWVCVRDFQDAHSKWTTGDITSLDADDVEQKMQFFGADAFKLEKKIHQNPVTSQLVAAVDAFKPVMPLVLDLGNPNFMNRHWEKLCSALGKNYKASDSMDAAAGQHQSSCAYTLSEFLQWGITDHAELVSDISGTASGEAASETSLEKMASAWDGLEFGTKPWRTPGTYVLVGIDEIQQELDDQLVRTQAMRGSRFVDPFLARVEDWESMLTNLQDVIDHWLKVQAAWLYLEPIFSSDDINKQIPMEAKSFKVVNSTWKDSMAATVDQPSVIAVARRDGLLNSLVDANEKLEKIQSGLASYLETKRLAFPRFFFLSNDELLSILAETKDPLRVQPHLKKCFDGICNLEFTDRLDIVAAFDGPVGNSERLAYAYDACKHKKINPRDSGGNVERWLVEVEAMMKKSLANAIDDGLVDFHSSSRTEWLRSWQGQVILTVNQITYTAAVEKAILERSLSELYKLRCTELLQVVDAVRGDLPKALRKTLGSLIVMDVHNRDVTKDLAATNLQAVTDFDWQAHLRYYVRTDLKKPSALTGEPGTIDCRMINAAILYAYEYIGNCGRLVITPLTDRCYRTLIGAIHLNLGGAPEGPAGTGKTEYVLLPLSFCLHMIAHRTTKDLAKAIAIQCVVTNCSDGLDYKAMAKFFKGLAASGAWACFDEFNRIQLEVLSVIAQQVLTIQQAKARRAETFEFEGTILPLKLTCNSFITMNPGYAGRAELPDNLKVLFRTVAMMVPDYAMIGEILLYSMGYTDAKALAVKIVTTYKLCSEQLSSQSHYDYGMRAVMAVLRAAGNLKRADGHLPEDILVLRSIIDVNLPKFLAPDVPLFQGITSDLFPGTKIPQTDRCAMYAAFQDICSKRRLQPTAYFWEKVVQIYDMMVVRHGFMIVGMPFSGKTEAWKVLAGTLGVLHERFPEDPRWTTVWPFVMNPKAQTMGQLYGEFDKVSSEWTDGCLAINYRNAAQSKVGAPEDRKWVLLDGPVDAIWIENMNTVLDDNKKLCLMSGEIIAMSDTMSMVFEPMDLLVASPATVSRCGMVYLEPEKLGWTPLLDSWLEQWTIGTAQQDSEAVGDSSEEENENSDDSNGKRFTLSLGENGRLRELFEYFVEPCMAFLRRELKEMSPTVDTALVVSLLQQMTCTLKTALLDTDDDDLRLRHVESAFTFALVWSVCVTVGGDGRRRMSAFLRSYAKDPMTLEKYAGVRTLLALRQWATPQAVFLTNPLPEDGDVHDWVYDVQHGEWRSWLDTLGPGVTISDSDDIASVLVPTTTTAQMSSMLRMMLPNGIRPFICGPTGTGKSVGVAKALIELEPKEKFYRPAISLNFSAKTSANMTQEIIAGQLTKRRKGVFGPPVGQIALCFVDDCSMPEVETYGAQPPIELLRQIIDTGGYYDLGPDKAWISVVDVVFTCATGPPGGGRNPLTPRFLRHFSTLCFDDFDDATLRRIFSTIVDFAFAKFAVDVKSTATSVVDATLFTYREAMRVLLPTPRKSHYVFNLRDFSRVVLGVLMADQRYVIDRATVARLWTHEALRVFADRLADDTDRVWFAKHAKTCVETAFEFENFDTDVMGLETSSSSSEEDNLRNLFFGNYMVPADEEDRPYKEIRDVTQVQQTIEQYLVDFNATSKKPMNLVMFLYAVEHVSRISRILQMPGGNALLVGVGGSGRQSLSILACEVAGAKLMRIEISKNYGQTEWRDDVKNILREAGTSGEKDVVFVFSDAQIAFESQVEDLNNVLNSGVVPNLFANDEKVAITEAVRPFAKKKFGKEVAQSMTISELYTYFVQRIQARLHVVLAFSPIGDAFRERLRLFPSLTSRCVIDWFTAWPSDALVAVADKFLSAEDASIPVTYRPAITATCQHFHVSVAELSNEFRCKTGRITYLTPTSYLELILAFKESLSKRRSLVLSQKQRYESGLDQLASAESNVATMQQELTDLQPVLAQSQKDTDALMAEIEAKLPGVREQEEIVGKEAKVAQEEADKVKLQVDEVQADLDEAIPALNDALKALDTIKPTDINEVKALAKPPATVKLVCEAVCVMLGAVPKSSFNFETT